MCRPHALHLDAMFKVRHLRFKTITQMLKANYGKMHLCAFFRTGRAHGIHTRTVCGHPHPQVMQPFHIIEISFDTFENLRFRDPHEFYPYVKGLIKDDGMHYILLYEIQLLDEFESVLNGLLRMPNVDLSVTGSNARFLSKDVITEFRGHGDEIYVSPLSISEFKLQEKAA